MPSFLMTWPEPVLYLAVALVLAGLAVLARKLWVPGQRQKQAVVLGGLAVLCAGLGWVTNEVVSRPDYCHYDLRIEKKNNQCVGISDGTYTFDKADNPGLDKVTRLIREENAAAEKAKSTATVAFMLPMTPDNGPERRQVLREVQGAYLAQLHANHAAPLGSRTPSIRLVLANPGRDYASWEKVTSRLHDMTDDSQSPLRAVTGFNLSVQNTEDALHALAAVDIPMVGGPITADEMENVRTDGTQRFPGMARTAPTNSDQAKALVDYNTGEKDTKREDAVLVVDIRPHDTYNSSLAKAFAKAVSPRTKPKEFESESPTEVGNVANQFAAMVDSVCNSRAKNIYFAGRPVHLRLFLLELAARPCGKLEQTVITGSGASTVSLYLTARDWKALKDNPRITLQYSAVGHPQMWEKGDFGKTKEFYTSATRSPAQVLRSIQGEAERRGLSSGESDFWDDSRAMSAFDSVWLAANALKETPPDANSRVPSLEGVRDQWRATYSTKGVPGVTGWFCMDNDGNPYNKAVAVVTLGKGKDDSTIRFEGMGWPGESPSRDCEVPKDG
ncbi:hypothetical protein AB0I94_17985 [Streptomyces sp. NPDC050147]|uniref:hypothetical protein n=1 Tax=Streptomyces sp. NPDC050147 TaxID=3155513 RepID=UPI003412BF60